jgi:hypothetical protein
MRLFLILMVLITPCTAVNNDTPTVLPDRRLLNDAVLAFYTEEGWVYDPQGPGLVFAVWPDGCAIWSNDRLVGKPPYQTGRIDKKRIEATLVRLDADGYFDDAGLAGVRRGYDEGATTLAAKSGKKSLLMQSSHELYGAHGRSITTDVGLESLGGQKKLEVMKRTPASYLYYRLAWSEFRNQMLELIPSDGQPVKGRLAYDAGKTCWQPDTSHK